MMTNDINRKEDFAVAFTPIWNILLYVLSVKYRKLLKDF